MDNQNISNTNMNSRDNMQNPLPNKPVASSVGPLVGIIIVVIIIVLGGMYFWGQRVDRSGIDPMLENDAMTQSLENQSSSDDLTAIEADIDNTDLENLDAELNQINSDLEASGL